MKRKELKTKNFLINNKTKNTIKKIVRNVINKILYILFIMLILYNVLYIINNTANSKKYVNIFNKIYITVEKDTSMKPKINKNDLIFVVKTNEGKIKEGDIIGYDINDEIVFHRVYQIKQENNRNYYLTKADNYMHNDLEEKTKEQINGKILIKIPFIGLLFKLFENKIITIFIIIILLLRYSFNKYRHEKNKDLKQRRKLNEH